MSNELLFDGMGRGWRKVVLRGAMGPSTPGSLRYYIGITGPGTNSNRQQGRILVPIIPLIMYYIIGLVYILRCEWYTSSRPIWRPGSST